MYYRKMVELSHHHQMAVFVLVHHGFLSSAEVHEVLLTSADLKLNT